MIRSGLAPAAPAVDSETGSAREDGRGYDNRVVGTSMKSLTAIRMSSVLIFVALLSPQILLAKPLDPSAWNGRRDLIADEQWVRAIDELKAAAADQKEPNKDEALFWLAHSQNRRAMARRLWKPFAVSSSGSLPAVGSNRRDRFVSRSRSGCGATIFSSARPPAAPSSAPAPPSRRCRRPPRRRVRRPVGQRRPPRPRRRRRRVLPECRGLSRRLPFRLRPFRPRRRRRRRLHGRHYRRLHGSRKAICPIRTCASGPWQPHSHGCGESDSDVEGDRARKRQPGRCAPRVVRAGAIGTPRGVRPSSKSRKPARSSFAWLLCASWAILAGPR